MLLCEGAHDEEFLLGVAEHIAGWRISKSRPSSVPSTFSGRDKNFRFILTANGDVIALKGLGGVDKVIGDDGQLLVGIATLAYSIGIIVDADHLGVAVRQSDVRASFSAIVPSAAHAIAGTVVVAPAQVSDQRKFGLWVAPDCHNFGQLDDVIRSSVEAIRPNEIRIADRFICDLGNACGHAWNQYKEKAVLCSYGQLWRAGGSLASSLQLRNQWITAQTVMQPNIVTLSSFLQALVA